MPPKPPNWFTPAFAGKELTPHKHWHEHAEPSLNVPWPTATVAEGAATEAAATEVAAAVAVAEPAAIVTVLATADAAVATIPAVDKAVPF